MTTAPTASAAQTSPSASWHGARRGCRQRRAQRRGRTSSCEHTCKTRDVWSLKVHESLLTATSSCSESSFKCHHQISQMALRAQIHSLSWLHFDAHMTGLPRYGTATIAASEVEDIWWRSTWHGPERFTVLSTVLRRRWPDLTNWMLSTTDWRFGRTA